MARSVGVEQATVANWEAGKIWPKARDLPTIAKELGCRHIDDLFPEEVRP